MIIPDLDLAIVIAGKAHAGQKDKAGKPYILHPLRVLVSLSKDHDDNVLLSSALLHDVMEDNIDIWKKYSVLLSFNVVETVYCLSRKEKESWKDYLKRVKTNPIATKIKIADLKDNLRPVPNPTKEDKKREEKYKKAITFLKEEE